MNDEGLRWLFSVIRFIKALWAARTFTAELMSALLHERLSSSPGKLIDSRENCDAIGKSPNHFFIYCSSPSRNGIIQMALSLIVRCNNMCVIVMRMHLGSHGDEAIKSDSHSRCKHVNFNCLYFSALWFISVWNTNVVCLILYQGWIVMWRDSSPQNENLMLIC